MHLLPEASRALLEVREQMRALAHGTNRDSLSGVPLASGISMVVAGATDAERTAVTEALASDLNRDVFRLDLAGVVSRYVGETEKNLDRVFAMAEKAGAVLVLDEGDALFGDRTEIQDGNDRYANLEVSYLLQRIESYQGLVIIATNRRDSIHPTYLRRFRFAVELAPPDE